jgi:hypothetical protein
LARTGEIPDVRAATSELRTASMARPDADRCKLLMNHDTSATSTSSSITIVRGSPKSNRPSWGGSTK